MKMKIRPVLVVLVLLLTFPIWIGIAAGLFGAVVGIFGAVIGIFAAIFGAVVSAIGGIFGWMFDWHWPFERLFNWNVISILLVILIVLVITRPRRS